MRTLKTICFFSGDITRSGGTERVATRIANELVSESEYNVIFLSLVEQSDNVFFKLNREIKRYSLGDRWISPGPGYIPLIFKVKKFLIEHRVDIIIDIDIVLDVLAIPACRSIATKVISWEHFNYQYEQSILYRKWILKYSVKRSDAIVTLTEQDKNSYENAFGKMNKIYAIGNPMDETMCEQSDDYSTRKNYIVTAARLVEDKGIDYLLEVAKTVLSQKEDWKWYLLGDGEQKEMVDTFIKENKLEGRLIATGIVSNVNEYLAQSKLYVMTSRIEGLPMCLLEAKSYGVPCISFDIATGPSELIIDNENGYLINPFDVGKMSAKLLELMNDEDKMEYFSGNTWKKMEDYKIDIILEKWKKIFVKIFSK